MSKVNLGHKYIDAFPTRVAGIPCYCAVTFYLPSRPGYTSGLPENCYPDEPGELEFDLMDRKGYRAKWLDEKLSDDDFCRLLDEYEKGLTL